MMATRHMSLYWELLKWLAIVALALATAIGFAARSAGAEAKHTLVLGGHRALGARCEAADEHAAAVCGYAKAKTPESGAFVPAEKTLQNLVRSLQGDP